MFEQPGEWGSLERFPEEACRIADKGWVDEYESRLGVQLVPIGFAYDDHAVLLLAEEGRVFVAFDDFLGYLGEDELAALELIVTNGQVREFRDRGDA